MKKHIQLLQNIVSRKGSSKVLTFSIPHVFKAIQILSKENYVSRATFCKEIHLGEGAVKTLISHLKEFELVDSTKSGTFLTNKGKKLVEKISEGIPAECELGKTKLFESKFNHAILLRNFEDIIKTGLEQRDYSIMYGAEGAATVIFRDNKFTFPGDENDCFENDKKTKKTLEENLGPKKGDVVIISSSNDPFVSEIAAKNSALWTVASS